MNSLHSRRRCKRLAQRSRALREFRPSFHHLEARQLLSGTASFVGTDAATQGAWQGVYGTEGFDIPPDYSGSGQTLPAYASLGFSGATPTSIAGTPTDPRLLQSASGGAVPYAWEGSDTFSIDVQLSDGGVHLLALYALDPDGYGGGRSERIDLVDDASGAVLDSRSLTDFEGGVYLAWDVSGDVTVRVTNLNPSSNALLGGLFLGGTPPQPPPVAAGTAAYVGEDAATQGAWQGVYGEQGFEIPLDFSGNDPTLPSYAFLAPSGAGVAMWTDSTTDPRALQKADAGGTDRLATTWVSTSSFSIDVRLSDGAAHRLALYALDWDGLGRSERIDLVDDASGAVLDSRSLTDFEGGVYLAWDVSGDVTVRVTNLAGSPNAVLSGLFLDGAAQPPADPSVPIITSPASASDYDITGRSTDLNVGASVDDGSDLTYSWSVVSMPQGAFAPQLSDNDSASASDVTATFTSAGDYTFLVTVDNDGSSATSEVSVTVEQTPSHISVSPATALVLPGESVQFTASAEDQFGLRMEVQPGFRWLYSSRGYVDQNGLYTAPETSGLDSFGVVAAGVNDFATVPIVVMSNTAYAGTFDPTGGTSVSDAGSDDTFDTAQVLPAPAGTSSYAYSITGSLSTLDESHFFDLYLPAGTRIDLQITASLQSFQSPVVGIFDPDGNLVASQRSGSYTPAQPGWWTAGTSLTCTTTRGGDWRIAAVLNNMSFSKITNIYASHSEYPYVLGVQISPQDLLIPHRTGDFQGQIVSDDVKRGGDPSQYVVLVDDYYTQSDGMPALASNSVDIPNADTGKGDSDLARITLKQLPADLSFSKVQIVLSDPTAVRLFASDGSLLFDEESTGDGILTLDLSNPSGYLAGLRSGDLDVWLEAVHPSTDFDFSVVYEDDSGPVLYEGDKGRVVAEDDVHMDIADWTFDGPDGQSIGNVVPIWEQELLDAVQNGDEETANWSPDHAIYKNVIAGLPKSLSKQLFVQSSEDPADSYQDQLINNPDLAVSTMFQAIYSTDDPTGGEDPLGIIAQDQRAAILAMLGINLVAAPIADSTLELGDGPNPTDKFTRSLTVPGNPSFTLDHLDSIYSAGQTVTLTADIPEDGFFTQYNAIVVLSDGRVVTGTKVGGAPNRFTFSFPVQDLTRQNSGSTTRVANYMTATLQVAMYQTFRSGFRPTDYFTQSVTIAVLPPNQQFQPWQQQAWNALKVNGFITGDVVKRNATITSLYVKAFNASLTDTALNFVDAFNTNLTAFEWAGVASFASNNAGKAMSLSGLLGNVNDIGKAFTYPDAKRALSALGQGNMTIFMDIYPQLLAYQAGGVANTNQMYADGLTGQYVAITATARDAWQAISTGVATKNSTSFWNGQNLLAKAEQTEVLQPVIDIDGPAFWKNVTESARAPGFGFVIPRIPGLDINLAIQSPVPGDSTTFQGWAPGTSFGNPWARYNFFSQYIVGKWQTWRKVNTGKLDVQKVYSGQYQ